MTNYAKNWCFTINNPTATLTFDDPGVVNYCVWQKERGQSGTIHYQGYIQFSQRARMKFVKEILGSTAHVEVARGTARRNKEYCSKDDDRLEGPFEYGKMKGAAIDPPKRHTVPLQDVLHLHPKEIAVKHRALYTRNQRGILALYEQRQKIERKRLGWVRPEIIVYYGPSGSGKTKRVYDKEGFIDVYNVAHHSKKLWFDGYDGETTILIDDFNGGIAFRQFLELTGGYPLPVERKGGFVYPTLKKIYITSNLHPDDWYSAAVVKGLDISPLTRRLHDFGHVEAVGVGVKLAVPPISADIGYPYDIKDE